MTEKEIDVFIEETQAVGDGWTRQEVAETYGDDSLETALADRKNMVNMLFQAIGSTLNRK